MSFASRVSRAVAPVVLAPVVVLVLASCGTGSDGATKKPGGEERGAAADSLMDWCSGALPDASLSGAGLPGSLAAASGWGEPGEAAMGAICGFTSDSTVGFALARAEFPSEAEAAAYVEQLPDESGSVDTFDSFSTSLNPYGNYTMKLQRGSTVIQSYVEQCPDEETCDEASAGLARSLADADGPDLAGACAGTDGDEYHVVPLVPDDESGEAFALVDEDGDAEYVATTGAGGLSTNVIFTMAGHTVSADDVETSSSGDLVAVEGRPLLLAGDQLEDLGYVLEKSWAIDLGDGYAAVTSYEGAAEPPAIEGRFYVSPATPCTTP